MGTIYRNVQARTMTHTTTNEIWVFGDLRTRQLLDWSLKVLVKAVDLAGKTGDRVVMFSLTSGETNLLAVSEDDACTIQGTVEDEAIAWGANVVYLYENDRFSSPTPHIFVLQEHQCRK